MSENVDVQIRAARANEANKVLYLLKKLQSESDKFVIADDLTKISAVTEAEQIKQINSSPNNLLLVAAVEQNLIAIITIDEVKPTVGELGIAVLQAYQNIGLGTAMLETAIDWFTYDSELRKLTLSVLKDNDKAYHLYQKLGFVEIGDTKKLINMKLKSNRY